MADEEANQLILAALKRIELIEVVGNHLIYQSGNGSAVGDLFKTFGGDNLIGRALSVTHRLEYRLGNVAGDGIVLDAQQQ